MTRDDLENWLASYRKAWNSDDPADISALFTEDATYSPWPYAEPWAGRDTIVGKWVERGDSKRPWSFAPASSARCWSACRRRGRPAYG